MAKFQQGWSGGPGRPRNADKHAGAIAEAVQWIADKLPDLLEKQWELAMGVEVKEVDKKSGKERIYTTIPDRAAGQYLLDRVMGKPTERQELSGPDGDPIELSGPVLDQAALELAAWRAQQTAALSSWLNSEPTPPTPVTPSE
jgi:hypothetical protein